MFRRICSRPAVLSSFITRLELLVYEHPREEQVRFPDHVERGLNLQQEIVEFVLVTSLLRQSWIVVL